MPQHSSASGLWWYLLTIVLTVSASGSAYGARIGLRDAATGASTIRFVRNEVIELELYVDTEGLTLEGYYLGVDFSSGPLTILSLTHEPLPTMIPDLLGPSVIDHEARSIRAINQVTLTSHLTPAVYVVATIAVDVGHLEPADVITVTPGLFGEVLGVGGGACPGTLDSGSCSVTAKEMRISPEPGTGLLVVVGLLGLGVWSNRSRPRVSIASERKFDVLAQVRRSSFEGEARTMR